jgi:hypothetical protein
MKEESEEEGMNAEGLKLRFSELERLQRTI